MSAEGASGGRTPEGEPIASEGVHVELAKMEKPDAAKRTSSSNAKDVARFPPDCGARGEELHLSRALAEERTRLQSPTDPATGKRLRTRDIRIGGILSAQTSNLAAFGVGITLYFKLFRFMVLAFTFLTLLGVPSLMFFYEGGVYNEDAEGLTGVATIMSVGNLGEGFITGGEYMEGEDIRVSCGKAEISSIVAVYGDPFGTFGCPVKQQPDQSSGDCPNVGSREENRCDGFCFDGEDPTAGTPCCAPKLLSSGIPDFGDVKLQVNPDCNSASAPTILRGLCLGRSSCNITISDDKPVSWTQRLGLNTGCTSVNRTVDGNKCVGETLGRGLDCPVPPAGPKRLVVVAKCLNAAVVDPFTGKSLPRADAALVITSLEAVVIVLALLTIQWVEGRIHHIVNEVDGGLTTVTDYSVFLPRLPPHDDVDELRGWIIKHLETVVNDRSLEMPAYGWTDNSSLRVADLTFSFAQTPTMLRLMKQRGKALRAMEKAQADLALLRRNFNAENVEEANALMKCVHERGRHVAKIEELDEELEATCGDKLSKLRAQNAFVTFEQEEGSLRALQLYSGSSSWFSRLFQRRALRLDGKYPLAVTGAVEASDVQWEHVGASAAQRRPRRLITAVLTTLLLLISFGFSVWVKSEQAAAERKYPTLDCEPFLPITKEAVVRDEYPGRAFGTNATVATRRGLVQCWCAANPTYVGTGFAAAPFNQSAIAGGADLTEAFWAGEEPGLSGSEALCLGWLEQEVRKQAVTIVAVLAVVGVNLLLKKILKRLVVFERHGSESAQLVAEAQKLCIAQFVNMALVSTLVNANLDLFGVSSHQAIPSFPVLAGPYSNFSPEWFAVVGSSITITMLIQVAANNAAPLVIAFKRVILAWRDRYWTCDKSFTQHRTQNELDAAMLGPRFLLAQRYGTFLAISYVCVIFGGAMPLLSAILLLNCAAVLVVDRWAFARLYRQPPMYDHKLGLFVTRALRGAFILRLLFSTWVYSNQDVFPVNKDLAGSLADAASGFADTSDTGNGGEESAAETQSSVNSMFATDSNAIFDNILARVPHLFALLLLLAALFVLRTLLWSRVGHLFKRCASSWLELEGVNDYFDALPTRVLTMVEDDVDLVRPHLREKYREALKRRRERAAKQGVAGTAVDAPDVESGDSVAQPPREERDEDGDDGDGVTGSGKVAGGDSAVAHGKTAQHEREMSGVIAYHISANPEFAHAFGLDVSIVRDYRRDIPSSTGDCAGAEQKMAVVRQRRARLQGIDLQREILNEQLAAITALAQKAEDELISATREAEEAKEEDQQPATGLSVQKE